MEAWRERARSMGVLVPASASWVKRGVPQLVQRPPVILARGRGEGSGGVFEELGGSSVGQPGPAGDGAQVEAGDGAGGGAVGEEHRAAAPSREQSG